LVTFVVFVNSPWAVSVNPDYPITAVPAVQVKLTDTFWAPKLEINRRVTIPHIMRENESTGRVDNFRKAAGLMAGAYLGRRFNDTDIYKVVEAASLSLKAQPDSALEQKVDELIALIAQAQQPDGYLFPARTIDPNNPAPGVGRERWVFENGSHELYNSGHLYEAAVAHFLSTGKRTLLNVAIKDADLVAASFGPNARHAIPGHEVIEVGLVKLYRVTGNRKYLNAAKFFIDERGKPHPDMQPYPEGPFAMYNERAYKQDQAPFVDQQRAVGHAVRAVYLYMGAADVAALTDDPKYKAALDRLWDDMTSKRMYLTGGIGARGTTESFGEDFELPNRRAYTETCASVGNLLWGHRMFLLHGEGKYLDVLEQVLYNGYLSGVSLSGDRFFYQNPLESAGRVERSAYFDVACCPANLSRLMEQIPGLLYSTKGRDVFVNLYAANTASIPTSAGEVRLTEKTQYPWDGTVTFTVDLDKPRAFTLNLRIPSWTGGPGVPGALYLFREEIDPAIRVTVNGQGVSRTPSRGFMTVSRTWKRGDRVKLELPMVPRRVTSGMHIADNVGKVAVQRGPIVYAFEGVDNAGKVLNVALANDDLQVEAMPSLLGGVTVLKGVGVDPSGGTRTLTAIPYYAWNNRGVGEMAVWMKEADRLASPKPSSAEGRMMAITFDDLPKVNGFEDIEGARHTTESILRVLKAHRAPAVAFVNEGKLYSGPTMVEERAALLRSWVEAGAAGQSHLLAHRHQHRIAGEVRRRRGAWRANLYAPDAWDCERAVVPPSVYAHGADQRDQGGARQVPRRARLPRRAVHDRKQRLGVLGRVRESQSVRRRGARGESARRVPRLQRSDARLVRDAGKGRLRPRHPADPAHSFERSAHEGPGCPAHEDRATRLPLGDAAGRDEGRRVQDAGRLHRHVRPVVAPPLAGREESFGQDPRRTRSAAMDSRSR